MKIAYTNKRLFATLILGFFWIGLGVSYILEGIESKFGISLTIGTGILFISIFIYEYVKKYIAITGTAIKVNSFPRKNMSIKEVIRVDSSENEVILVGSGKILRIEKSRINKNDLPKLEIFIHDLNSVLSKGNIIE